MIFVWRSFMVVQKNSQWRISHLIRGFFLVRCRTQRNKVLQFFMHLDQNYLFLMLMRCCHNILDVSRCDESQYCLQIHSTNINRLSMDKSSASKIWWNQDKTNRCSATLSLITTFNFVLLLLNQSKRLK